jgi:hypothetical protein
MITFITLLAALIAFVIIASIIGLVCGAGLLVVFGDLIVFVLIVWALAKLFKRKK